MIQKSSMVLKKIEILVFFVVKNKRIGDEWEANFI